MIVRVVLLAALLAGLIAWDRLLVSRADTARLRATMGVGRMLPQAEMEKLDRAAIRIEWNDGRAPCTLIPMRGTWRLLETYQVPADARAIEALVDAVTTAEGYVHSEDPDEARGYGFGTPETVRFSICGRDVLRDPKGDVQWSVDIGHSRSVGDGAFMRPHDGGIWAVDRDPRAILEGAIKPGLPPLIDPSLLGQAWLEASRGIGRIKIEHADGDSIELSVRAREVTEEELRAGVPPYEWVIDSGGEAVVPHQARPGGYATWLENAGFAGLLDPRRVEEDGLTMPRATVTLFPARSPAAPGEAEAPPLVLQVLVTLEDGRVPIANLHSNGIFLLPSGFDALVAPVRAQLVDTESSNVWEPELHKMYSQPR